MVRIAAMRLQLQPKKCNANLFTYLQSADQDNIAIAGRFANKKGLTPISVCLHLVYYGLRTEEVRVAKHNSWIGAPTDQWKCKFICISATADEFIDKILVFLNIYIIYVIISFLSPYFMFIYNSADYDKLKHIYKSSLALCPLVVHFYNLLP